MLVAQAEASLPPPMLECSRNEPSAYRLAEGDDLVDAAEVGRPGGGVRRTGRVGQLHGLLRAGPAGQADAQQHGGLLVVEPAAAVAELDEGRLEVDGPVGAGRLPDDPSPVLLLICSDNTRAARSTGCSWPVPGSRRVASISTRACSAAARTAAVALSRACCFESIDVQPAAMAATRTKSAPPATSRKGTAGLQSHLARGGVESSGVDGG